jgi:hypothetical protein
MVYSPIPIWILSGTFAMAPALTKSNKESAGDNGVDDKEGPLRNHPRWV